MTHIHDPVPLGLIFRRFQWCHECGAIRVKGRQWLSPIEAGKVP